MAEVPDIPPLKPIWPTRPEDRNKRRPAPEQERDEDKDEDGDMQEKEPHRRKPDDAGNQDGHIDEYV